MGANLICYLCPNGCELQVLEEEGRIEVDGNLCEKGAVFAENEFVNPQRLLTTTMRIANSKSSLISVRSDRTVKKAEMKDLVALISKTEAPMDVAYGQVLLENVGLNGVSVVVTGMVN